MDKKQIASIERKFVRIAFWLLFLASFMGAALAHLLGRVSDRRRNPAQIKSTTKVAQGLPTITTGDLSGESAASKSEDRTSISNLYLQLAAIIQGISITIIGQSIVQYGLELPINWQIWLLTISSFNIALIFWLEFTSGYLYLYQAVEFKPFGHMFITTAYFLMGICQVAAFSLIHQPFLWFFFIAILAALAATYSFLIRRSSISIISEQPLAAYIQQEHSKLFKFRILVAVLIAVMGIIGWQYNAWLPVAASFLVLSLIILVDLVQDFRRRDRVPSQEPNI